MIKRMITTVIATAPMFLTISVMVNSLPPAAADGEGLACQRTKSKLRAFVPRMLVRIVTVDPPKELDYKLNFIKQYGNGRCLFGERQRPRWLLRHKVVDDYA